MTTRWRKGRGLYLPDGDTMGEPFLVFEKGDGTTGSVSYASKHENSTLWGCQISSWQTVTLDVPDECLDGLAIVAARCTVQMAGTENADAAVWCHVRRTGSGWGIGASALVPPDFEVVSQSAFAPPFQAYARVYGAAIEGPPAWDAANESDTAVGQALTPLTGATLDLGWGYRGNPAVARVELFSAGFWSKE